MPIIVIDEWIRGNRLWWVFNQTLLPFGLEIMKDEG